MLSKIIDLLCGGILDKLIKLVCSLGSLVVPIFSYLENTRKDKKEKEIKEAIKEFNKQIDEIADNGTLNDLLNLRK